MLTFWDFFGFAWFWEAVIDDFENEGDDDDDEDDLLGSLDTVYDDEDEDDYGSVSKSKKR